MANKLKRFNRKWQMINGTTERRISKVTEAGKIFSVVQT
jgi:hypothetical protein